MKLKKRLKGTADVGGQSFPKDSPWRLPPEVRNTMNAPERDSWDAMGRRYHIDQDKKALAATSPVEAAKLRQAYTGPDMPDKGMKDGSCNRSACQAPLKGEPQFWMKNHRVTNGRLYYCANCERLFTKSDREFREPLRCTPDEDNVKLEGRAGERAARLAARLPA